MNVQTLSVTSVHRLYRKTVLKGFGSGCLLLLFFLISAFAETHYVSLSGSHIAPFTDWMTAATNIQAAIDAASAGDTVLVSNGIYATGGRVVYGALTNRVAITKPVTVRSVHGPAMTIIQGAGPVGDSAVRCAYVGTNAVLEGFTLTNGATRASGNSELEQSGGGVWCESLGALSNCVLTGNSASYGGGASGGTFYNCTLTGNSASYGGGAYSITLRSCTLTGNLAYYGGGAYSVTLHNCTLTGNLAYYNGGGAYNGSLYNCTLTGNLAYSRGGGASGGTLYNCIAYYNSAGSGANYDGSTFNYSCTTPHPGGSGNITSEPQLASFSHLAVGSPCQGAGHSDYAAGTDIDGEAWHTPPSMGCDEVVAGAITGALNVRAWVAVTNVAVGFSIQFKADILGRTTRSVWDFGDGTVLSNNPYAIHTYALPGVYAILLRAYNESYPQGITATVTVHVAAQAIHYVKLGNTTPLVPYTSWATAATNIQDALDVANQAGALVLVSNGIYATGGRVVYGALTNRVAITKPVTVRSVHGPAMTIIQGTRSVGDSAVRCVYVGTNAVLEGFMLTDGATRSSGYYYEKCGGGVCCESSGVLSNCVLTGNSAFWYGGGAYYGTLYNCTFTDNSASSGGGAYYGTLYNCTFTDNSAFSGGGAYGGTLYNCTLTGNLASSGGGVYWSTLYNCIVYYNEAGHGANYYYNSIFNYSCTTPEPDGSGNITSEPQLASSSHLAVSSPCRGVGHSDYAAGTDIDGEAWRIPPSMGCDEVVAGAITGALSVSAWAMPANVAVGFPIQFRADIVGRTTRSVWDFGDGTVLNNKPYAIHAYTSPGVYAVLLRAYNESYPQGITATVTVHVAAQAIHYVKLGNATSIAPYTSWATAATNIQDALDAADQIGALVLVSNGIYATGGRVVSGSLTNRVAITKPVKVCSVNGPSNTIIQGAGPVGDSAVRCAYVGINAVLEGFTLTNGATRSSGDLDREQDGGGVWCESSGVLSNCVLTGNSAYYLGGGAWYGTLYNCMLTGNSASWGGGAHYGTLNNCTLTGNSASNYGGGVCDSTLYNCTLTDNSASYGGGGACWGTLYNCIIYYNNAPDGSNYWGGTPNYSCTAPDPGGVGNITNDPCFVNAAAGDYHLQSTSPCINAGNNQDWMITSVDMDGNPRIRGGVVDMGAYESDCLTAIMEVSPANLSISCQEGMNSPSQFLEVWNSGCGALNYMVSDDADWLSETPMSGTSTGEHDAIAVSYNVAGLATGTYHATITVMAQGVVSSTQVIGVRLTVTPTMPTPIHYVNISNTAPMAPYASWMTAATNIQAAIDAASDGDTVLVSNGIYATGGRVVYGAMSNRVAIAKPVTVRSVNGPAITIIQGAGLVGDSAVRCAYVGTNAVLEGFTLTNGKTRSSGDYREQNGGGVWCESSGVVSNCILTDNSASINGGGAYDGTLYNCTFTGNSALVGGGLCEGTLYNCTLTGNSASYGGGACNGTLYNCTLTGNSASYDGGGASCAKLYNCTLTANSANHSGGGISGGTLYNCIVYYNEAARDANYYEATFNYSCTTPYPGGLGNIANEPQLASFSHLAVGSPCQGAGHTNYATGTDIDGEAWRIPPSMGCDEVVAGVITGALSVSAWAVSTNAAVGFPIQFRAEIVGRTTGSVWDFGDGTVLNNKPYAMHAYASPGVYAVLLRAYNESYPQGITATVTVQVAVQAIHYVKLDNATSIAPYTSWATAATNIQDAIDAADQDGALVLVSSGVYVTGGRVVYGVLSNRVAITKPVIVRSVNGPAMTIIQGAGPMGESAVRCAYVGINAVLEGFTLTKGATRSSGDLYREQGGGGVWCESFGVLSNCVLTGNLAAYDGGGAYWGTFYNCVLTGNSASYDGGGAYDSILYNCTLTGNSASDGGGAYWGILYNCTLSANSANLSGGGISGGTLYNCIVYYNDAALGANYASSTFKYSCTTPDPGGSGNITSEPQLASFSHLAMGSPCQGAGHSDYATGTDIDGEAWRIPPSMGCDEVVAGAITGALNVSAWVASTNAAVGFPIQFRADIVGRTTGSVWDFGDGTVLSNKPYAMHAYASPGVYAVLLRAHNESYPQGITATVTVQVAVQAIHYVKFSNATSLVPYTSWETAATNIQDAIDAVDQAGALVLVSNGVYATGGRVVYGVLSNRVAITKPVTVRSVNGPAMTIIQGAGPMGKSAVRCAYVGINAVLEGFTLTNGATCYGSYDYLEWCGGGMWCENSGVVSNCVLTGNSAYFSGGGAYKGTLYNCTLTGNSASNYGGGAYYSTLYNCTLTGNSASSGGGAYEGMLYNCMLTDNSVSYGGGGAWYGTLYNCMLTGNSASWGGGAYYGTLNNCTLTGNSASDYGGGVYDSTLYNCTLTDNSASCGGGGACWGTLYNCIIYYNNAPDGSNYSGGTLNYSCTTPDLGGVGNITNDPRFVNAAAGDYHLQFTSPCINAGTNQDWMVGATDLDGNPRLDARGRVDMGAYEYQGISIWSNTTAPIMVDAGPDSAVELGVKFKSGGIGTITGIRFYKAAANTGTHVGNLWTSNGTLLATATFSNETDTGWQEVLFAAPVAIASNTIYVASYHADNGHYSEDDYYFRGKGLDNPPLHAPADGVAGGNGVYRYGRGNLFPNQTWHAANYYVDVVFQPKPAPTLKSIAVTPANSNIVIGATRQFTAIGTYSDGSTQNVTSQAIWISSNTGVATINATGLAMGVATGITTISATLAGVIGTTTLTVQAAPLVITTTLLPDGISNTVYTATLTADGGTTPYTWSIISGTLPVGLTLNSGSGVISGTPTVAGTSSFTVQVSDVGSHIASKTLSISMIATPTVITIWPSTAVPGVVDEGPDNAVELGVKFKSDVAGTITGIRFYKADANTGTHVGNLWTSNGTLLATVIFSNETVSGWQQTLFATPVTITSNTVYVASYHANNGHYSADVNYFEGKGVDNPPLHAPANSVSGGNGVYRYGANSLFPNQSWNAANYWVDVVFQPIQSAPLVITTTSLPNGAMNMAYLATLTADGGALPYTWSIINGTLPAGLTLNSGNGVISGTPTVLGTFSFTVQVSDVGSHTATRTLSITITSIPAVVTIWPSNAVPGRIDDGPDKAVELGVKFKSDVAGTITGIRFYKGTANTGVHVGNLWASNGTRLATVTFSNETPSGWQQALFATPVAIASSTVYVASYHAKNGHYSADVNYFEGKGVDNPPLHALTNGVSGGNGVYAYGSSSTFPNQTYNTANYWVDVVFQPASPASLTSIPLMAAGENLEQWPWVWTSGDLSKECGASNLIDGNTNTMWIGNVGGEPWRVILDLGVVTDVTGIQLMFQDTAWTNKEMIGSRDSEVWFDYLAETNEWVPLRYLYVNFFGDEHGAQPPAIREIIWQDR